MSGGERVPLDEAREIAKDLAWRIEDVCKSVHIAGSIRRQKPDIGDIDLVCEPIILPVIDLFGNEVPDQSEDLLAELLGRMVDEGRMSKRLDKNGRASWGAHLKRATYHGLNVDIQSVTDPDTWGMWFLIRTGPADFNRRMVTPRWQGGLLPPGMEVRDGFQLWRMGARVPTPTEQDVFAAYGLDYVEPEARQ